MLRFVILLGLLNAGWANAESIDYKYCNQFLSNLAKNSNRSNFILAKDYLNYGEAAMRLRALPSDLSFNKSGDDFRFSNTQPTHSYKHSQEFVIKKLGVNPVTYEFSDSDSTHFSSGSAAVQVEIHNGVCVPTKIFASYSQSGAGGGLERTEIGDCIDELKGAFPKGPYDSRRPSINCKDFDSIKAIAKDTRLQNLTQQAPADPDAGNAHR